MKNTTKSSKQNQTKVKIDRAIFEQSENNIQVMAKIHFGYTLTAEELKAIQPVIEGFKTAAPTLNDAIMAALRFIIDPARCNWKLVNKKKRKATKKLLLTCKENFYGGILVHLLPLIGIEDPRRDSTSERK